MADETAAENQGAKLANGMDKATSEAVNKLLIESGQLKPEDVPQESEPEQEAEEKPVKKLETKKKTAEKETEESQEDGPPEGASDRQREIWAKIRDRDLAIKSGRDEARKELASLQQMRQEIERERIKMREWQESFRSNPVKAIESMGYSWDDVLKRGLTDGKPSVEETVRRTREELDKKLEQLEVQNKELRSELDNHRAQLLLDGYRDKIRSALKDEKFEILGVESDDPAELVFEFAKRYCAETENSLDPQDACEMVLDRVQQKWERQKSNKAIRAMFGLMQDETESNTRPPRQTAKPRQRNLTNAAAGAPTMFDLSKAHSVEDELRAAAKLVGPDFLR